MDAKRFDSMAKTLSAAGPRRGVLHLLGALPLGGVLALLRDSEPSEAKRRKKVKAKGKRRVGADNHKHEHRRRKHRNKGNHNHNHHRHDDKKQPCKPESAALTCDGQSGTVTVLHTYQVTTAWEVVQTIPVSAATLRPLLPDSYSLLPAAALGLGGADQGVVIIANFQGQDPVIDQRPPGQHDRTVIAVGIVVAAPAEAAVASLDLPGAFHIYKLAMYSDDAPFAASLRAAGMPTTFQPQITYARQIDDATGVGTLAVSVPDRTAPFHSRTDAFGYQPAAAFDAIFWQPARHGVLALQFHHDPVRQGQALSQLYAGPESRWGRLLLDGGLGSCPADPASGDGCVRTPALNVRYDQGATGRLHQIDCGGDCRARNSRAPKGTRSHKRRGSGSGRDHK